MIERIQQVRLEFEIPAFSQRELLSQREVHVAAPGASQRGGSGLPAPDRPVGGAGDFHRLEGRRIQILQASAAGTSLIYRVVDATNIRARASLSNGDGDST